MSAGGKGPSRESYVYFPGCSLSANGIAYDESLRTLYRLLGVKLKELEDWNCCGATSYMCIDEGSAFLLSARNLSIAHQMGAQDILAPCSACYLVLRKTQDYIARHPSVRLKVAQSLDRAGLGPLNAVQVKPPVVDL